MPSPRAVASEHPGLDQLEGLGLVAAPRGQHQRRVPQRCHAGRLDDRVGSPRSAPTRRRTLRRERAGTRDRWPRSGARAARRPRARRRSARVASSYQSSSSQRSVRQRDRPARASARRVPSIPPRRRNASSALPQRRHAGRVALGEPRRQAVEEQVDRAGRLRRRPAQPERPRQSRARPACRRGDRRTSPPPSPRDGSRAPARRRAVRGAGRHRATAAGASLPRVRANAISARSRSNRARWSSSSGRELGGRQQLERRVRMPPASNFACAAASARLPLAGRIGGQLGRARQERGGRRRAPTGLRPVGRALQLGGHRLVGPGRRLRPVPGAAIGIGRPDRSPRPALDAPPGGRESPPPGRPPSGPADGGTAPGCRARSTRPPRPALPASPPIPRRSAARHSRLTSPTGSAAATSSSRCVSRGSAWTRRTKRLLDAAGQRPRVGKPEPARELGRRQPARQLQQRQRVAARLGDDPIAHPLVQPPRHGRRQQRACVAVGEARDDQLRQAGRAR